MTKMNWLEHNAYTRQQTRSGNLTAALFFLALALVWCWPTFRIWQSMYHVLRVDDSTPVEGYVEQIRGHGPKRAIIRALIEYQGESYTVCRTGFHFTTDMFEQARETRRVTVYVNRENPAESVMSVGVPPFVWGCHAVFSLPVPCLLGAALYFFRFYRRNCREESGSEEN